ncbi:phosphoglucosamine mutase [Candidatus Erwinia haradaeae]|uniref:Phosphoglucosamine mutase n=1 Tax=Candidatus Erwinia haradaeae TaxID=1922217 RepID=A0A451DIA6_9GAMM|nr:phosphoglucosamine mutase [Candidatus Erwinia haradaeae]VFP86408.1 Phosphoglucosamine mutase [Candidatus Erwinia haradaeae]
MRICKYFGTDGIRGKAGNLLITPDFFLKLGFSVGKVLSQSGSRKIIIGKDTRISGDMLELSLAAGLSAAGLSSSFTGPMPTPAIAYFTRIFRAAAGVVISASHNPFYDNGIKFFSTNGGKFSDKEENAIEYEMEKSLICVESDVLGRSGYILDAACQYIEFCKRTFPSQLTLDRLKIVVDCAHGATFHIAPNVLEELGATIISIGVEPNGININKHCGSTDLCLLQKRVVAEHADVGIAYDGDGDRVIMVDHMGCAVDGDQILYLIAREQLRKNLLIGGVVGTLMSNQGLELALKELRIPFFRTKVGDRHVLEMLNIKGWRIGGENSGHIILLDQTTTGDGIIAGLQVLAIMLYSSKSLHDLCRDITLFPQKLVNIPFIGHQNLLDNVHIKLVTAKAKAELQEKGRIILRVSGTEPLIRIMVEGEDEVQVGLVSNYIAHEVQEVIRSIKTYSDVCEF